MEPLSIAILLCGGVVAGCWMLSVFTQEYSWTDRAWYITPIIYVAVFAHDHEWDNARLYLMFGLVLLWGVRLTLNYARKGGIGRVEKIIAGLCFALA